MVWSTPLASTSVLPFAACHVSVVMACAATTAVTPSSAGWLSRTVTRHAADFTLRPKAAPRRAVPSATLASVRARPLPATTQGARVAAGSAAVMAAALACRYAVAEAEGPAAAALPASPGTVPAAVLAAAGAAAANAAAATAAATMCAQCRLFILTPFGRVTGWRRRL